jgi:hypothetical protein
VFCGNRVTPETEEVPKSLKTWSGRRDSNPRIVYGANRIRRHKRRMKRAIVKEPRTMEADDVWQCEAAREYGPGRVLGTDE